ncbi:MAG TPA: class F sortase [Frankiaceae bacterium]|nr:class F sortase [Frankiaceae bacterium]
MLAVLGVLLVAVSLPAAARGFAASARQPDVVTVDGPSGDRAFLGAAPELGLRSLRSSPAAATAVRSAPVPSPVRLTIPAIELDTDLTGLTLHADGRLQTPPRFEQPGWYQDGPAPGAPGAALIVGHVDSYTGPAVFYRLERLRAGDVITVRRTDGSTIRFAVRLLESYRKDAFPTARVFGGVQTPELRLVTCSGPFDKQRKSYTRNLVVFATQLPTPTLPSAS